MDALNPTPLPGRRLPPSRRKGGEGLEEAIRIAGSPRRLGLLLDCTRQTVNKWRKRRVPAERVLGIEHVTGVARWRLRPDLYPRTAEPPTAGDRVGTARVAGEG